MWKVFNAVKRVECFQYVGIFNDRRSFPRSNCGSSSPSVPEGFQQPTQSRKDAQPQIQSVRCRAQQRLCNMHNASDEKTPAAAPQRSGSGLAAMAFSGALLCMMNKSRVLTPCFCYISFDELSDVSCQAFAFGCCCCFPALFLFLCDCH